MRATLFALVVPLLLCGSVFALAPVPKAPAPGPDPDLDPAFAAKIKLPEVDVAKALDNALKDKHYLCVTEQGKVLVEPNNDTITTLENLPQVEHHLKRRAKEDQFALGSVVPHSTIILRVDKDCPFEKTYAILKAGHRAGYTRFQWRVSIGKNGEGQIPFVLAAPADEKTAKFVARVTSTDKGAIEKITLTGDGIEKELDLKADLDAFTKKLKELAEKNKDKRLKLTLELGDKLLQAHVVKLYDLAVGAGFKDVAPVPIDPKKR